MKKTLLSVAASLTLAGAMFIPNATSVRAGAASPTPAAPQVLKGANERHPEIRIAFQHLEQAKANLVRAEHDFGGHRQKALDATDEAMRECKMALEFAERRK